MKQAGRFLSKYIKRNFGVFAIYMLLCILCSILSLIAPYISGNFIDVLLHILNFQPEIALKASQAEKLHVIGTLNLCFGHTHIMFFRKFKSCL